MAPLPPVAVDAMGGDQAPAAVVEGAVRAARQGYPVVLVGDEAKVRALIPAGVEIPVRHAADAVAMEEAATAVRCRPDTSVRRATALVAAGEASSVVTCGHSGAAMAAALMELGRLPGVERPAITAVVPRTDGAQLVLLDLGANVDCRPAHLAGFALLGDCFARSVLGVASPRVGLLSNGEEAGKGNEVVRGAAALLDELPLCYVGPVEPTDAFRGECDVLVCDGFVGNVMLKTVEATAEVVGHLLKEELSRHASARLGAWLLQSAFKRFRRRTDHSAIGGALLLGVNGIVIVGHGRSDGAAVQAAIRLAHRCAAEHLNDRIARQLAEIGR